MMLKSEDDDGYCSRSSLDSPIHSIKLENATGPAFSLGCKNEDSSKQDDKGKTTLASGFLEVMLVRDDWKKSETTCNSSTASLEVCNASLMGQKKSVTCENEISSQSVKERASEKEFQPRRTIKLMPSSSQNLLLFAKQSALSGLVMSSKSSSNCNPVTLHSIIKNNNNIFLSNHHMQHQVSKKVLPGNNTQSIKLLAADVLKSKTNHLEVPKKLPTSSPAACHKKVVLSKDSNHQGSSGSFTSARTSHPYVKNSRGGGGWLGRSSSYVGRHELHPVIDHDYCEFSAFNAEIQSGIILMSRETCARTDRMNMKRNKASLQSPAVTAASSISSCFSAQYAKTNVVRSPEGPVSLNQHSIVSQSQVLESKRKYLKRKILSPSLDAPAIPVVKNAVGRPRLSGKIEKSQVSCKRGSGYDSSEDLVSPPLTEDKNYVKIPGSFQNDFVYYATIRGRSSRKRHSEVKQSSQAAASAQQKNACLNNIKAFEWYKEMAKTDKSSRFGSGSKTIENVRSSKDEAKDQPNGNSKLDITSLFCSQYDEGKNLISESEVADLVMQMLPSADVERSSLFQGQFLPGDDPSSSCKLNSDVGGHCLMDGMDIGGMDLNSMASELGSMLASVPRQDAMQEHQGLTSIDFPSMTSSQLLEDICENDLLMSTDIANMNAFLSEFTDGQTDICNGDDADGVLSSMIRGGDVMGLLESAEQKLEGNESGQISCLTPPDSATLESNEGLSFPCDLKEFALDGEGTQSADACLATAPQQEGELLTPPPSLPPSSAPPELTTVNVFWNDLPGLLVEGREYVRLVDIHKQIMPAKDTGILKKRCIMLGLEVSSCSELQRDFLIRYMNAAKSKSRVIVAKDIALDLINFYVNPKMRSELMAGRRPKAVAKSVSERLGTEKSEVVRRDPSSPVVSTAPLKDERSRVKQMPSKNERSSVTPESIKRSARLHNKRFSYLDMVNNGLPSRHSPLKSAAKPDFALATGTDLQQQWLEMLKCKFSQGVVQSSSGNESDSVVESLLAVPNEPPEKTHNLSLEAKPLPSCESLPQSETGVSDEISGETQKSPCDGNVEDKGADFTESPQPASFCSEAVDRDALFEIVAEKGSGKDIANAHDKELRLASEKSALDSTKTHEEMSESETKSSPSQWKSERVLRSSTSQGPPSSSEMEAIGFGSRKITRTFPAVVRRQRDRSRGMPSNENQAPRLIRSKRHFLRPTSSSAMNCHKRQPRRFVFREGSLLSRIQERGKSQPRPQRRSKKKFNVLKF